MLAQMTPDPSQARAQAPVLTATATVFNNGFPTGAALTSTARLKLCISSPRPRRDGAKARPWLDVVRSTPNLGETGKRPMKQVIPSCWESQMSRGFGRTREGFEEGPTERHDGSTGRLTMLSQRGTVEQ